MRAAAQIGFCRPVRIEYCRCLFSNLFLTFTNELLAVSALKTYENKSAFEDQEEIILNDLLL